MPGNIFFEQERNKWRLSFIRIIVFTLIALLSLLIFLRFSRDWRFYTADLVLAILIVTYIILYVLAKRGYLITASIGLIAVSTFAISFLAWRAKGIYDSAVFGYMAILVIAYLLMGWQTATAVLAISLVWLWTMGWMQINNLKEFEQFDPVKDYLLDISVILVIVAALSHFYLRRVDGYIKRLSHELDNKARTQDIISQSEANYRALFEQASEGILIGSEQGIIMLANESICRISGYSQEELINQSINILFTEQQLKENPFRYDLVNKEEVVIQTLNIKRQDGSSVPVEMRSKQLPDGRLQAFFTDITERVQAEKSLRDFERIFNLSANPICISDTTGTFVKVNPAMVKVLEYKRNEIEGAPIYNFMHPDDIAPTIEYVKNALIKKTEVLSFENRYLSKSGKTIWFSWMTQPVYAEEIAISIAHDITGLKRIESELTVAKEKAEESDRLKTAFLENMSHEIRTPMNGILGFSEMIASDDLEAEERKSFANIIINSGNKLLTIVDDILDISRIETGQIEIKPEPVDLKQLVNELYQFFHPKMEAKGLLFKLTHSDELEHQIITDKVRVNQILINLVSNALKFTSEGFINIAYKVAGSDIVFSVEDSGIGIDAAMHEKIFDRFTQADMEATRKYGGTGLGLAISKRLAELLGGKMWLKSVPGEGSVFYFSLPNKAATLQDKSIVPAAQNLNKKDHNKLILIAEDDPVNYNFLEVLLERHGYQVIWAETGLQAMNLVKENEAIWLVLMDIKMPEMDGYTATREIKKIRPNLPIIAQTAYAMVKDNEKALNAGCDDYIAKPIMKQELLSKIEKFIL